MENTELLPCPFCGGEATRQVNVVHENGAKTYETGCNNAGCSVHPSSYRLSKQDADEAWNTRTQKRTNPAASVGGVGKGDLCL